MLVFKLTILVQRNVLKALVIIISAYILITLILTQRIVLGIVIVNIMTIIITQRIVLGLTIVNIRPIVTIIITQRIVLGVIIVNIDTAAILILVTVTNITLGIMTYGIVTEIVTTIGSIASGSIIFVQGTLGITTTCMEDTTIVKTSPTNSTAIGRPTTLAISSANQWISTPETTTSAKRT
jgi:hypothetical protein